MSPKSCISISVLSFSFLFNPLVEDHLTCIVAPFDHLFVLDTTLEIPRGTADVSSQF